jgi:hypothetical protein
MDGTPTWRYYVIRAELAVSIFCLLLPVFLVLGQPTFLSDPRPPRPFGLVDLLAPAGYLGMIIGLVWMIRIFRGPPDDVPPWRYRDR